LDKIFISPTFLQRLPSGQAKLPLVEKMTVSIDELEKMMKLMQKYQIDELELGELKLHKKLHMGPKIPKKPYSLPSLPASSFDEDIMFASSSAPKLSMSEFNRFAANPVVDFDPNTAHRLKD
jgi:hypothetical protein